jgi:hypothetical protein
MKKLIPLIAIIFGWTSAVWGATEAPVPLTTVKAIRALSYAEASKALPVAFEATVTYYRGYENTLFVEDGGAATYVSADTDAKLVPGDRVLVHGRTQSGFGPYVTGDTVTLLHHGDAPKPVPATFDELIRGQYDCMLVTVHAIVRSADLERRSSLRDASLPMITSTRMELLTESGNIEAYIDSGDANAPESLLDAEVEITGVAGGVFDGKMQQTGVLLHVSCLANVKVLKSAAVGSRSLPVTPMDRVLTGYRVHDLTQRVRVHGTITYYQPGQAVVLQSGSKSLWIATKTSNSDLRINDGADATGFPDAHSGFLTLINGEIWDNNISENVPPAPATWKQLASSGHPFDLVSIEGNVVTEVRETLQDEYVLSSDGQLFTAFLGHLKGVGPSMKQIPPGSRVRVTGICILENSNPFNSQVPFNILLRTPGDIVIVAKPSMLNIRNLIILLSVMLLAVISVSVWGAVLNRKVYRQTGTLEHFSK